jgi:hypothetical protein
MTRKRGSIIRACPVCGGEVRGSPSTFEKYNTRYCSRECRWADSRGENHHNWVPRINKICKFCGKEYGGDRAPCYVNDFYCSRECFRADRKPKLKRVRCKGCGEWFSALARRDAKFCTVSCYQAWRANSGGNKGRKGEGDGSLSYVEHGD